MSFAKDLMDGVEKEEAVAEFYNTFLPVAKVEKRFAGFDLLVSGAIEVKYDRQAPKTGNIAIEYLYRGEPSGITATQATNWVICTEEGAWTVPTGKLRVDIVMNNFPVKCGGDKRMSEFYLVPYEFIKTNYTKIF